MLGRPCLRRLAAASSRQLPPSQQLPPGTLAAGICCWNVDARRLLPSRLLLPRTFLPVASFHTPQMLCVRWPCLLRIQDCRLRAFTRRNSPQRPYTVSCWGFKSAICQPSKPSTPHSSATHCLVEGSRLQTPKLSAALHTVLLTLQGYRLRASQPLTHCLVGAAKVPAFKPLNAPQRPYTVFC